ncbi:MAG: mechanosensitive ion channel [Fusobacterium perfoetens]|uniref:mechanosensitive ion channel family protein n=1 Tax=Fusobacterium perfoetens TaxID=852 RepID=UPI0023F1D0C6|nr:mechanosensitive ion channel domain-containing protein [Fusobacterium perfoetens]MCI6152679.1 mechanosensitive ion channel [Fusobacterium perfoetens]MDY3237669.1 mechanosensitive ion channel [Fusobacterium perfoetens]
MEELTKFQIFLEEVKMDALKMLPSIAMKIVWVIFLLVIFKPVSKSIIKFFKLLFDKNKVDPLLKSFIISFINVLIYISFFVLIIGGIGVRATSLVTILGTAGLAVGLALQGSLSNLAGGVLILFFKPFSKGDYIITSSGSGTVESIYILYTIISTVENFRITIPNSELANSAVTNVSRSPERMIDTMISVSYDSDIDLVKETLTAIVTEHKNILKEKGYVIRLKKQNSSSLDFVLRAWVKKEDYWSTFYDLMETIVIKFREKNIEIPYNKLDVYQK